MTDFGLWVFAVVLLSLVPEGDHYRQPLGDDGRPCPWPFDPIQLHGQPIGQYHCPACGSMVLAGVPHIDYVEALR